MRAKACTRCRQWKVRCDAGENNHERCTRCRSNDSPCVLDGKFKRISRDKALAALQAEVERLTRLRDGEGDSCLASVSRSGQERSNISSIPSLASHNRNLNNVSQNQDETSILIPNYDNALVNAQLNLTSITPGFAPCVTVKCIGELLFTAAQIDEFFRVFFTRCHVHLPFTIVNSVEEVYNRSPLLFWAICVVSSEAKTGAQLMPYIQSLIPDVLKPPHNIETVQGLLLICTWPFPFLTQSSDPSFLYAALAVQIGYAIGLHRPNMAAEFNYGLNVSEENLDVRRTTWLACFIVNQIQASRRGIPSSIIVDQTLLNLIEDSESNSILATLCQISILSDQSSTTIGASADNPSGMLDPKARVHMVKLFGSQFESLQRSRRPEKNEITEMVFLSARLQLWTFILLEDVPITPDLPPLLFQAENDATRLIQIACEKNLSLVPFHICRAVVCAAVILIKILRSPFMTHHELLRDQIERARIALSSASRSEGDVIMNVCGMLLEAPKLESKKSTNPIRSRMSFSLVCDFVKTFAEHISETNLQHQNNMAGSAQFEDGNSTQSIHYLHLDTFNNIDLDGLSWDEFFV